MNNINIRYWDNGQKWYEIYYNDNGKLHREDGPAYNIWYKNGQKLIEEYWINGIRHREYDPAYISWYENDQIEYEIYYINGKIHREDGPAWIKWNKDGQINYEEYWINGKPLNKFEIRKLKLEKLNLL